MELVQWPSFFCLIVLGPLCVFTPKLNRARLAGLRTYGRLASEYVAGFAEKWTTAAAPSREPLLGSADIRSLADLDNSYSIVREMRLAPFGKQTVIRVYRGDRFTAGAARSDDVLPRRADKRLVAVIL